MNAGRALTRARKRAGLSQRDLAERAGVTQSTIARVESGSMGLRVNTFERLLRECGFALEVERRLGIGVDRTTFSFEASPDDRIGYMATAAVNVSELFASSRNEKAMGPFDPLRMLIELRKHEVDFVVIGGMADAAHGGASITDDLDICYSRSDQNVDRLLVALTFLEAASRDDSTLDARTLKVRDLCAFDTPVGKLDCVRMPRGTYGFDDVVRDALNIDVDGADVMVASLDDLVRMKRAAGRLSDLAELEVLGALREETEARDPDTRFSSPTH